MVSSPRETLAIGRLDISILFETLDRDTSRIAISLPDRQVATSGFELLLCFSNIPYYLKINLTRNYIANISSVRRERDSSNAILLSRSNGNRAISRFRRFAFACLPFFFLVSSVVIIRNPLRVISSRRECVEKRSHRQVFTFSFVIRYYFLAPPLVWRRKGGIRGKSRLRRFESAAEDQSGLASVYIFNFNLIFRRSSLRGFVRIANVDAVIVSKSARCTANRATSRRIDRYGRRRGRESENEEGERERKADERRATGERT